MSQGARTGRPLPRFGEWDVKNPASAEGFTVIFNKARDQKKTNGTAVGGVPSGPAPRMHQDNQPRNNSPKKDYDKEQPNSRKWLCCFSRA